MIFQKNTALSGRAFPEWVAGFIRNGWQGFSGIGGRFHPVYAKRTDGT